MQTINLNQNSFRLFPTIYMVQNDTGRELKMILDDVTLAGTETGAVAIKRSDGSYYTISATIDTTNNAFDADMTQALTQPSRTECQLKVTASDDTVISTYTFAIMVQPSTDGISEEQLGYSVQQLRQDAEDIRTGGMPADLRLALLQIAQKVAYIDDQGAQYYQDLYDALLPSVILTGITAVYTQSGTVYDTDSLDSLKDDLVVTASYSDGTTETLPASAYTLSGTLEAGTSTITVTYETETDTFSVTVTANPVPAEYEVVDYISSNNLGGTPTAERLQYSPFIKTAFPASDTDIIGYTVRLTFKKEYNYTGCPFGGRNAKTAGATTRGTVLTLESDANRSSLVFGNNGGNALVTYIGAANLFQVGTKYTLEVKNDGVYADGVLISSIGAASAVQLATYNWGLFCRNNQGSWATSSTGSGDLAPMIGRIYEFSIMDGNGDYVLNYVPCRRKADSVYGMYDTVGQTFYTSQGQRPFIGGNE